MEVAKRTSGFYQSRPQIVNDEGPMMRPLSLEAARNIFWGPVADTQRPSPDLRIRDNLLWPIPRDGRRGGLTTACFSDPRTDGFARNRAANVAGFIEVEYQDRGSVFLT